MKRTPMKVLFIVACTFCYMHLFGQHVNEDLMQVAKENMMRNMPEIEFEAEDQGSIQLTERLREDDQTNQQLLKKKIAGLRHDNHPKNAYPAYVNHQDEIIYVGPTNSLAAKTFGMSDNWINNHSELTGEGMIIGMWDVGVPRLTHQEFEGRAVIGDGFQEHSWHATHVAGTLGAAGIKAEARGMAPKAIIGALDWGSDEAEMSFLGKYILTSNHSYGVYSGWLKGENNYWYWYGNPAVDKYEDYKFGFYGASAKVRDEIAYHNPYYLIVQAAGNSRNLHHSGAHFVKENGNWVKSYAIRKPNGEFDCMMPEGTAKNSLTVGAVHKFNPLIPGFEIQAADFSSAGPTDDGRIKPDIMGVGVDVYSTINAGDDKYSSGFGTSMATPTVTGSLNLLQQNYYNRHGKYMRASTLKALAIHTARDAGNPGPDYTYGWGVLDMEHADNVIDWDSNKNEGAAHIIETTVFDGPKGGVEIKVQLNEFYQQPMKVTAVWTDLEGEVLPIAVDNPEKQLVVDIDLHVEDQSGSHFLPWSLDPQNPAEPAFRAENHIDNVEQVEVPFPGSPATYTIYVRPTNNQLPHNLISFNVSLIITGVIGEIEMDEGASFVVTDEIKLYPNPSNDGNFEIENITAGSQLVVVDSYGYEILYDNITAEHSARNPYELDLSRYGSGLYYLTIRNEHEVITKQIVVQ